MGNTVSIDNSNPDLFKPYEPKLLQNGKHLFEVGTALAITPCKAPSENSMITLEARCQDEGECKGTIVYERFVFIANIQTSGQQTSKEITEGRLAQFAVACGVMTEAQIKAGEAIPLDEFLGRRFEAITKVVSGKDQSGNARQQNSIARFLFEPEKAKEETAKVTA